MSLKKTGAAILIIALAAVLALSLTSCLTFKIRSVKGSGNISTQEIPLEEFDSINFSGIGNIYLVQGESSTLKIEAEENIIPFISVDVKGSTLNIGPRNAFMSIVPTKDVNFYITVKDLDDIVVSGAGNIKSEDLDLDSLKILSSGLGNIDLNLEADDFRVSISGAGKINVSGEAENFDLNISGLGTFSGEEFLVDNCDVSISGAGNAVVNVVEKLKINISGFGKVKYMGSPQISQDISGAGSIESIDNQ